MQLFKARRENPFIYLINFPDKSQVLFKILKWSEFKAYRSIMNAYGDAFLMDIQEDIFTYCLLDTSYKWYIDENNNKIIDWEIIPAGVVETVANLIYMFSGAADANQLFGDLEEGRYISQIDSEKRIISTVSAINKLKPEDYESMFWPDIVTLINHGELFMMNDIPSAPFYPAIEEETKIDFEKENREDDDANSAVDIVESRKQRTRDLRKQYNIK